MNKKIFTIEINENEYWYGGMAFYGKNMPFDKDTNFQFSFSMLDTDQSASFLISNQGRYVCFGATSVNIHNGKIEIIYSNKEPTVLQAGNILKDAYLKVVEIFFDHEKRIPPKDMFVYPQFNDWMEVGYNQNQADILAYAKDIKEQGYPYSVLMIDDKWSDYYGSFDFNKERFPDAQAMIKKLNGLGFKVMVWETPFVSPDGPEYRELSAQGLLVKDENGQDAIRKWWNGYSAVMDLSNPTMVEWLDKKNQKLFDMGIVGFKFDAGDMGYYHEEGITYGKCNPMQQSNAYCAFGRKYPYCEFRSVINQSGTCGIWRQQDKRHTWGESGIRDIVSSMLMQNLLGYWYAVPDMVGGGCIGSDKVIDEELVVRFAQASALMPMMQFSRLPYKIVNKEYNDLCIKYAKLHTEMGEYIYQLAKETLITREPIVRMLEYVFPNQGFEKTMDQFMLGDRFLVAPVIEKTATTKIVKLPQGCWWKYIPMGKVYVGGETIEVEAGIGILPYFERILL